MVKNLHAFYYHGNLKAFRAELDGSSTNTKSHTSSGNAVNSGSASGGRSWTGVSGMMMMAAAGSGGKADPNERDALGRT